MYDKAHEYIEKMVFENDLSDMSIKDVINNIEMKDKQIFVKAPSIVEETNLAELLFKVYGTDSRLLRFLLTHY